MKSHIFIASYLYLILSVGFNALAQTQRVAPTLVLPPMRDVNHLAKELSLTLDQQSRLKQMLSGLQIGGGASAFRPYRRNEVPVVPDVGGGCFSGGCCSCPPPSPPPKSLSISPKSALEGKPLPPYGTALKAKEVTAQGGASVATAVVEKVPPALCDAEASLKKMPDDLKARARKLVGSQPSKACGVAVNALSPLRDKLLEAYDGGAPINLDPNYTDAAKAFREQCLSTSLLNEGASITPEDQHFLFQHVGMIVERVNPEWGDSMPVCHAFRSGRFVLTAQHCLPVDQDYSYGAYENRRAFRHFNSPTLYGLRLRMTGSEGDPFETRHLDVAVYEIEGADISEPFDTSIIGQPQPYEDFILAQSNVYTRIASDIHSGSTNRLAETVTIERSILCRPAHIDANGIFLHACQTEGGTSGVPLFQKRNGRLVFVGLHTGPTDALPRKALSSCSPGLPNYGVSLPIVRINAVAKGEQK